MLSTKEIFKASPVSISLYLSIAKLIMKEMPNDDAADTTDCLASNSNESILPALAIFLACLNVTHPAFTNVCLLPFYAANDREVNWHLQP